jgi:hypothetical protein
VTDYPPRRRRVGPLFVLLLVVLAGIGGTIGYLGAQQVLLARQSTPNILNPAPTKSSASPLASDDPAAGCPSVTKQAVSAGGLNADLDLVLYVAFHPASGSGISGEAWICRNSTGLLIYHGHSKNGPLDSAQSDHTLLLCEGIRGSVRTDADGFIATNPSSDTNKTDYHVSRTELVIIFPSGNQTKYLVDRAVPAA